MYVRRVIMPTSCVGASILLLVCGLRLATPAAADDKAPQAEDLKARQALLEAAKTAYQGYTNRFQIEPTRDDAEVMYRWSRRWLEAEHSLANAKDKRVAAYAGHLERMRTLEEVREKLVKDGFASKVDLAAVRFYRLEAERWLADAKER
jgi:hypothetical protein